MVRKLLLLLILIPLIGKAEIKVEADSVTGLTKIYSIITNPKNPFFEIIFTRVENEYWLTLTKVDKKCWNFKGNLGLGLAYMTISVQPQFRTTNLYSSTPNAEACTTRAVFQIINEEDRILEAHNVVIYSEFKNKSPIHWMLPKDVLGEWKWVINYLLLKTKAVKVLSENDIKIVESDTESFPDEGKFVEFQEPPQLIEKVEPEYPLSALQNEWQGITILAILVDKKGKVRDTKVFKSSEYKVLDDAALKAARGYLFKPAIDKNGQPVAVWIYFPVHFQIR